MTEAELVEAIRGTFPGGRLLEPEEVAKCPCRECTALRSAFERRYWTDVDDSTLDKHSADLPLFTPAAFRQFLPAFMVRGLLKKDEWWQNEVLEFTCYPLLPDNLGERWHERVDSFTQDEADLIRAFLEAARETETSDYDSPNPQAIEYWQTKGSK